MVQKFVIQNVILSQELMLMSVNPGSKKTINGKYFML